MPLLATILTLLAAVTLLAVAARRIHVPYPTVMVVGGLLISFIPGLPRPRLDPELFLLLFLPPLLYAAAWESSWRDFKFNLRPILLLAVGFVIFTTCAVALFAHRFIDHMPWAAAFALGAVVSPPDPIAATAIAHRLGVPRRIITILDGEGLLNDATGLTVYRFAVRAAVTGTFSIWLAGARLVLAAGGGVAIGLVVGWLVVRVHKLLEEPQIETVITLLTPFAAYLPAEAIGVSGVLAAVTAGLFVARRSTELFSSALRVQARATWDSVIFILNGLAFILVGLQLPVIRHEIEGQSLRRLIAYGVLLSVLVIIARIIWVFPSAYLPRLIPSIRRKDPMPPWQAIFVVAYTGMRGTDSLAAALAVPLLTAAGAPFPARNLIIFLTFCVILATLVVQTLTLPPIICWLGLRRDRHEQTEEHRARIEMTKSALKRLDELCDKDAAGSPAAKGVSDRLRGMYRERLKRLESRKDDALDDEPLSREARQVYEAVIGAQRDALIHLRDHDVIGDEVLHRIESELDFEELRLGEDEAGEDR
jgi:CPA1 family monovalent cation:H+ antiporter